MKLTATLCGWLRTIERETVYRQGVAFAARYYTAHGARMNRPTAYQLEHLGLVQWDATSDSDIWKAALTPAGREAAKQCREKGTASDYRIRG